MAWQPQYPAWSGYTPQQTYIPQMPAQAPQSAPVASNPQAGFRCIPVTSRAEAEVYQIPFDGSTTCFMNTSNGEFYTKVFDFNTGSAPLTTYVRERPTPAVQYATLDDLKALRDELMAKPKKAVKKDDASDE